MARILVIDDSPLVSDMLREHLAHEGYEVAVAADANQGYRAAIEFQPDLILLDVQLPDVVGFDLIRIIKNREDLREIPVIMMTGTAHKVEERVKGFQLGADDYVLKPFEMPELLERIKALLRRSPARVKAEPVPVAASPVAPVAKPAPGAKTAKPSGTAKPAAVAASTPVATVALARSLQDLLLFPETYVPPSPLPAAAMAAFMTSAALLFAGLTFAAGATTKPAIAGLSLCLIWTLMITTLVVTSSVIGVACTWKEAGRMLGLSSLPLMLKGLGATVFALWTTLPPFLFTSGPAVFWKDAPFWASRFDIFELWAAFLLWRFMFVRAHKAWRPATITVAIVWAVFWALLAGCAKLMT